MTVTEVSFVITELKAQDRCDRCNAPAKVRAITLRGGELLFCNHHGKGHEKALREKGAVLFDETGKLLEQ